MLFLQCLISHCVPYDRNCLLHPILSHLKKIIVFELVLEDVVEMFLCARTSASCLKICECGVLDSSQLLCYIKNALLEIFLLAFCWVMINRWNVEILLYFGNSVMPASSLCSWYSPFGRNHGFKHLILAFQESNAEHQQEPDTQLYHQTLIFIAQYEPA